MVRLRVQETFLDCGSLQYLEDPKFTGYRVDPAVDTELEVKIQVGLLNTELMMPNPPPHMVNFHLHFYILIATMFFAERKRQL